MSAGTIFSFVKLILSKPIVTLRLISLSRLVNAFRVVITNPGNIGQLYLRYRAIYLVDKSPTAIHKDNCKESIGDIIFFPVIDWHFRFQRPQHLATELAKLGYRVFYLSATPLIASRDCSYAIQESPVENIFVVQLSSAGSRLPNFYQDYLTGDEIVGFNNSLQKLFDDFEVHSATAIVHHPFWYPVLAEGSWASLLYDCIDHHSGFCEVVPKSLVENEKLLIQNADVVTVTSNLLSEYVESIRPCHLIRNGCEFSRFASIPIKKLGQTTIGYVGAISAWFDVDILLAVAKERPEWDFVLVGSTVGADVSKLKRLSNVIFQGELPYADVPEQIASFDVCLIPFKINALTASTNPVKVYEYLAAGRPVVATCLPELAGLDDVDVFLANSSMQLATQIERALLVSGDAYRVESRRNWARTHDWSTRAVSIADLLSHPRNSSNNKKSQRHSIEKSRCQN